MPQMSLAVAVQADRAARWEVVDPLARKAAGLSRSRGRAHLSVSRRQQQSSRPPRRAEEASPGLCVTRVSPREVVARVLCAAQRF